MSGARAGERHRFSTITFPSCGASKFRGATDIAISPFVYVGQTPRDNLATRLVS